MNPSNATPGIVRIACCQLRPSVGDVDGNRRIVRRAVGDAVAAGARLIVLPELCTTGYFFHTAEEARALGQGAEGGALSEWAEEAARGDAVVVGGFAEVDGSSIYNSAALVDGSGVLAVYRKTHLWDSELRIFERGDEAPPVVCTTVGMVGLSICYDLFFPELTRKLALDGADVIVAPTNAPTNAPTASPAAASEDIGVSVARATAHVNRVFVAVCDRWGAERGTNWVGRSLIVNPDGEVVAAPPGDREQLLLADCDLTQARDKQWSGTANDALADRRPELYRQHATRSGLDAGHPSGRKHELPSGTEADQRSGCASSRRPAVAGNSSMQRGSLHEGMR
jgi:predicted amidohydrolase